MARPTPCRGKEDRSGSQGAGGDFSHNSPSGRYAVDIAMPVGTPIVAARAGTVVKVRDGQGGRLPDPAGNHVRIEHDDGTTAPICI